MPWSRKSTKTKLGVAVIAIIKDMYGGEEEAPSCDPPQAGYSLLTLWPGVNSGAGRVN